MHDGTSSKERGWCWRWRRRGRGQGEQGGADGGQGEEEVLGDPLLDPRALDKSAR
jgi:hypothetical protein